MVVKKKIERKCDINKGIIIGQIMLLILQDAEIAFYKRVLSIRPCVEHPGPFFSYFNCYLLQKR